jgi:pyruvate dehydrogenase E1 component beta subunit
MPCTPTTPRVCSLAAIRDPDPVVFFEPKRVYRAFREQVPEERVQIPSAKAKVVSEGTDITIVTWGAMRLPVQRGHGRELPEDVSSN